MSPLVMMAIKKLGKKEYLAQQEKIQQQKDRRSWKDEGPLAMPMDSGMSFAEKDNFRQKMKNEYGDEWKDIVSDYNNMVNPQMYPGILTEPGMSFDPTRFRTDNPLSLLRNRGDIDAVLRDPTKQDYMNEIYRTDEDALLGSVRPPMQMRTDGIPVGNVPTMGRSMTSLSDPVAQSANWPEGGVGGGAESGLSPWKGYSMGTTSYNVPTERDFMTDLTQGYGPEGFQNVVDPDQLAGIRATTGSPDYLIGRAPTQGAPVEQPQLSPQDRFNNRSWISRIHSPEWDENAATSMNRQPAPEDGGLLGSGTGYNKSNRFNNIMAEMIMRSGVNTLNRNRDW